MISIVLVEPENQGNIGAIARLIANFEFEKLILINPKCKIEEEAYNRAKHAQKILKKAKISDFSKLKKFDYLIGTTAKLGSDYNIPRCPVTPEQLAEKISKLEKKTKIAILFGREGTGLTNEELKMCDFTVTIPGSKNYPTLNLSHAVGIILYELFKKLSGDKRTEHIKSVSKREKDQIEKMFIEVLDKMTFSTPEKKETQKIVWKKIFGKSFLTKREAFAVMGFLKK
ncbi:MAG: RNA methyltransferase, partial [Nanoarchaeota archaeon]|nr:RNA methyltransferase [Nanoarchaeota archaeon]